MRALASFLLVCALVAGCGDEGNGVGDEREAQARSAAGVADLSPAVADFLALLGRSVDATFQVTFPTGEGRGTIVLSQVPPDRRVDVTDGREIIQSDITRGGVTYRCAPQEPGAALECSRSGSAGDPGAFDPDVLARTAEQLRTSAADHDLVVEDRTIAGVDARCLVVTRKPDRPPPAGGSVHGTVCLSSDGAVLAVVRGEQRLEATGYTRDVPAGTFELPTH
jgi:hypothetical protein